MGRLAYSVLAVCLTALSLQGEALAQGRNLPDFGSPADSVLSKSREAQLGRSVMLQLRNAGAIIDDPQLNEYIRLLGSQLASHANDGDFNFEFFVIDEDIINAFAMPGGVIGVNAGLILASENENELAGVLAHEVSHVTQRHIARMLYDTQRQSILTLATTIAAILLGATSDSVSGESMSGLITAGQAAAAQRQINFTRQNEHEADRVGMDLLARAGFDPNGMAGFFEKLSRRTAVSAQYVPEMLRTHPVSTTRIAEARARARQLPRQTREDSLAYGLAKARLRALGTESPDAAVAYYAKLTDGADPADRYGRALSLMRVGRDDEAERLFRELAQEHPNVIAFRIGQAEALMASGFTDRAMAVYHEAERVSPRNVPLVISYAESLLAAGRPAEAHAILLDLLNNVRPTPEQIELIARAANAEGDIINAHHYMSEYFASIGDLKNAINQLRMALESPGVSEVERVRFVARMEEFQSYLPDEEQRRR